MKRKMNPLDISYFEQMRRFGLGFMLTSFWGDVTTSIKLGNADLYEKYEKAKRE